MARIRTIKPAFFTSEDTCSCSPLARLLFLGLLTEADRAGRLEDRPRQIKRRLLCDDDCDVDALLWELVTHKLVRRYTSAVDADLDLIQILNFEKHQKPHPKETASTLPSDGKDRMPVLDTASREQVFTHPVENPSTTHRKGREGDLSNGSGTTGTTKVAVAPLIESHLRRERRLEYCAFVGSRLEVPQEWHIQARKAIGGENAETDLQAWYVDLNDEIEEGDLEIPKNSVFKWLDQRYERWRKATTGQADDAAQLARLEAIARGEIRR